MPNEELEKLKQKQHGLEKKLTAAKHKEKQLEHKLMSSTPNRSPRPTHTLQNNTANTHIWCQLHLTMILNRHPAKFCNFNL